MSRRPQQGQRFRLRLKTDVQMKFPSCFLISMEQAQAVPSFPTGHQKVPALQHIHRQRTTAEML